MQKKKEAALAVLSSHWKNKQFDGGMTGEEILAVLRKLKINPSKFLKKLGINTCVVDKETKKVLHYHCDIERWHLYWKRLSGKWWPYIGKKEVKSVEDCLREVENDDSGCFWG